MKYMVMMFGDQNTMMETRSPEWIREMIQFMGNVDDDLRNAGEFVYGEGLADGARRRPSVSRTAPRSRPTGRSRNRRSRSSATGSSTPRRAARDRVREKIVAFTESPIEVRQVMDAPPEV